MSSSTLLGLLAGVLLGTGLFALVLAFVGLPERDASKPPLFTRRTGGQLSRRLVIGGAAALVALVLSRWVVLAIGVGLLAAYWDSIAGGGGPEKISQARLEGLASWTESLRDTIAGAIGLEQAIPATAATAAPVLRPSLNLLVDRLRIREPLPDALLAFADDLDDPSADAILAALVLNARLRGPGLRDVLTSLAASAREELDMRGRVIAARRSIRRSVRIVVLIVMSVVGLMVVFNRDSVSAYNTFVGQIVLAIAAALFAGGILWLRRLAQPPRVERFLTARGQGQRTESFESVSM